MQNQAISAEKKLFYDELVKHTYDNKIEDESGRAKLIDSIIALFQENYSDVPSRSKLSIAHSLIVNYEHHFYKYLSIS